MPRSRPRPEPIPLVAPWLGARERRLVAECVRSGWVSSRGRFVDEFERRFAAYCGARHGVATSSGTTALHLALLALGVGPGDDVLVPTLSFVATANAVRYVGARPVFVDSEPETWTLDPAAARRAITRRTRAIVVVHLYGHPAAMDEILALAARDGLPVVEDACQAHGSEYRGRRAGSLGTIGCFSFFANKLITTGEGGMLVTDRRDLADTARLLRDHGMSPTRRYWHPRVGFNYRMTNLQAALGVAQLDRLDALVARRRRNARQYAAALAGTPAVAPPPAAPWARPVPWLHTVLLRGASRRARDRVAAALARQGIETRPVFYPISALPPYRDGSRRFPVAERLSREGLSLPSSPHLTAAQIARVCAALRAALDGQ